MVAQFAARDAQELTQDALIDASMSLLDVTGTNATLVFQVVGLEIENLAGLSDGSYDTAAETIIELAREQKERNDNDGKDAAIAVMEEIQAAELARLSQPISVGGIEMTLGQWEELDEALDTPEEVEAATNAIMAKENISREEAAQRVHNIQLLTSAALKKANGQPLTAEEQAVVDRAARDPEFRATVERDIETVEATNIRPQSELSADDAARSDVAGIEDNGAYLRANVELADDASTAQLAVEVRGGTSMAGDVDPEGMFDMSAYSAPAEEFNAAARGQTVLAQTDLTLEPILAPTLSGPTAG